MGKQGLAQHAFLSAKAWTVDGGGGGCCSRSHQTFQRPAQKLRLWLQRHPQLSQLPRHAAAELSTAVQQSRMCADGQAAASTSQKSLGGTKELGLRAGEPGEHNRGIRCRQGWE